MTSKWTEWTVSYCGRKEGCRSREHARARRREILESSGMDNDSVRIERADYEAE
jgi:hypothetical protein